MHKELSSTGVLDTMLTVATTIGKIAGALAGGLAVDSMVDVGPRGKGDDPSLGQLVFFRNAKGEIVAFNQSTDETIGLFFPGNATVSAAPTQIFIPPTATISIAKAFEEYSAYDVDAFNVVPLPSPPTGTGVSVDPEINIQAQATQPILPGIKVQIGPYFSCMLNAENRTVVIGVLGTLTLGAILLLNVRGAGETVVRIINALRQGTGDDPQSITVEIPSGIDVSGGLTEIDISASVGGLSSAIDAYTRTNAHLFGTLSEEDGARIAAYAAKSR